MAEESTAKHGTSGAAEEAAPAAVHIVHVEQPEGEPQAYHLRTLASVLGNEDAAREALVYSYSHAASGFAAKLTPKQAEEIGKQPGVLLVQPDRVYQVQTGPSTCHQVGTNVL